MLLRGNGQVETWAPTGTEVGLFENWNCEISETGPDDGGALVLYSWRRRRSGRRDGEAFGDDRLIDVLRRHSRGTAQNLPRAIVDATREFSVGAQQDDVTLVAARALAAINP